METSLNILISVESMNEVESYISQFRNAGIAAHAIHTSSAEHLEEVLLVERCDIALCATYLEELQPEVVLNILKANKINAPHIILTDQYNTETVVAYMKKGAKDVVDKENTEHLKLVIKREFEALQHKQIANDIEKQLKEVQERCNALMESSQDAIAYIQEGVHIAANSVYLNKFGFEDADDLLGVPVMDMVAPEDHKKFKQFLREYQKSGDTTTSFDVRGQMPDGRSFDASLEFSPATIEGESCTQVIIREKADSKELEAKIEQLSTLDLLTSLYNRQYFMKNLEIWVKNYKPDNKPSALFFITIDDFKSIRKNVGIETCDEVLVEAAELLASLSDESHILSRFDDHVFTLIVQRDSTDEVKQFADQLCKAINDHKFEKAGQFVTTECSIGVEFLGGHIQNAQEFIYNADTAAESASLEGGNQVRVHNPITKSNKNEDASAQSMEAIRYALTHDRFSLIYQPIVGLQGDTTENYCVLLRMLDENGSAILPADFLPTALKHDFMFDIDCWVINNTLKTLSEQRKKGRQLNMFVKVTGGSLGDKLILFIVDCMKKYRVHGGWIVFEIDEVEVRAHIKQTKIFLHALQKLKCRFALDSFGTEPNFESILQQIKSDFIKIDASLINGLTSNEDNQKHIKVINELAHTQNSMTVAKSVEDANTLAFLWSSSIDYIQGYFLQEPSTELSYDFAGEDDDDE